MSLPPRPLLVLLALSLAAPLVQAQAPELSLLGRYETGLFDEAAAEIAAYDAASQRLFFVNAQANQVVALDVADPALPVEAFTIDMSPYGAGANSVAVANGVVAVAAEADPKTAPGVVAFFDTDGGFLGQATVGALPDGIAFTPDGRTLVVANEGEPNADYTVDPEGTVSLIRLPSGAVQHVGFADFNVGGPRNGELPAGVRIFGPGATVAQDLEPEFPAVSPDGQKAYVSLQENNALAVIDLATGYVDAIVDLGTKDHSLPANALDASDRDDAINITTWPVRGYYLPDALATFAVGGQTYVISANEGDAREYDTFAEEARVEDLTLDPTAFPDAAALQLEENLGRLAVTTTQGDTDGDGDFDVLYSFGGRSFAIWDAAGALVYDSGDALEQLTAAAYPDDFNANNDENGSFDSRSDAKGPEPEAVAVGVVDGTTYAFVGMERIGGVAVYDVSNPAAPVFVDYVNSRDFSGDPEAGTAGDLGPESIVFISAAESPTGVDLLAVAHEVSGSVAFFRFAPAPAVTVAAAPAAPPVTIPAGGGSFDFTVTLTNTTAEAQTVDVWSAVRLPDGTTRPRVLGPRAVTLAPGETQVQTLTQQVPGFAPAGAYAYSVRLGDFRGVVLGSEGFAFMKDGVAALAAREGDGWAVTEAGALAPAATASAAVLTAGSFPNPFAATATLRYTLPDAAAVRLTVYDMLGREVVRLVDDAREAGTHTAVFDGASLPSGVYVYELRAGDDVRRGRMSLVR